MWFYPLIIALVILAIVGGTLAGGVFTIVLVPLAAIALISSMAYWLWSRALQGSGGASAGAGGPGPDRALPHRPHRPSGREPSSPERLVDARRQQQ
jgi:hypothetical protein